MARPKAKTIMTFAVTFPVPQGMSIASARELIIEGLQDTGLFKDRDTTGLKVSLTNKEVQYAKR